MNNEQIPPHVVDALLEDDSYWWRIRPDRRLEQLVRHVRVETIGSAQRLLNAAHGGADLNTLRRLAAAVPQPSSTAAWNILTGNGTDTVMAAGLAVWSTLTVNDLSTSPASGYADSNRYRFQLVNADGVSRRLQLASGPMHHPGPADVFLGAVGLLAFGVPDADDAQALLTDEQWWALSDMFVSQYTTWVGDDESAADEYLTAARAARTSGRALR